ncbi:amidase signature domain-containing protein [Lipomyces japonicus]|uniref:amidase signature domain-containing protein n=1 Tax=Lipomyces japonicus TaxID=56871 RepID=UPI0034CFE18F
MTEPVYKFIAAKKQKQLLDAIPLEWRIQVSPDQPDNLTKFAETCGILTEREIVITSNYDAVGLLEKVHKGEYSALEVTIAFCKRAALAQQCCNCLTEIFFDRAFETAKKQDEYFAIHGKPVGLLHGLPISIKDSYNIKGVESTIGIAANVGLIEPESSTIVDALEAQGGIMYVKTNVPQSMMVLDTENNVFGPVRNPYSKHISAAGSSGGAGAIVAFRGSLVGMATDIGGSIRVPAYANGCYGFKPSSGRNPYYNIKGYWTAGEEYVGILCVDGPITTSARDLTLIQRAIAETEPWNYDPTCLRLPWSEPKLGNRLRLGVIRNIPMLEPIKTIFNDYVAKVEAAGHELVDMDMLLGDDLAKNCGDFFRLDGGDFLIDICKQTGEPLTQAVLDGGLYPSEGKGIRELFKYTEDRTNWQKQWLDYWASTKASTKDGKPVEFILMPTQAMLPRPKEALASNATVLMWNALDYPAAVFPVHTIDLASNDYEFEFAAAKSEAEQRIESLYPADRQASYQGFPVGVQVVGQKHDEPALLAAIEKLSQLA